jgi:hypothetical protein
MAIGKTIKTNVIYMQRLLRYLITAIVVIACIETNAQSSNPILSFYTYGNMEDSFDDNSSVASIGDKKCYFNSYPIFIEKGTHFYMSLSSSSDVEIIIRNKDNSIDTTFFESGIAGVNFQRLFIAPESDSFKLYIVCLENLKKTSYRFSYIEDRLYKNSIPASATFEDRLQTLMHYREMKFLPLKGKLISETPDMFQSVKKYAANYELVKGVPVYFIGSSLPDYIITQVSKADSKAKAIIQLNELKSQVDKYFAGNKKIEVSENKNEYNENLPNYTYSGIDGRRNFITLDIEKGEAGFYYVTFKIEK